MKVHQQQSQPESQHDTWLLESFLRQCDNDSDNHNACLPPAPELISARGSRKLRGVPVSVIVQRLGHFLRLQSIEHCFQWDKTKPRAYSATESSTTTATTPTTTTASSTVRWHCRTEHLVRFCVSLWRGEEELLDSSNRNGTPATTTSYVVVEVQRRSGCSMELQCVRRALLAALLDEDTWSTTSSTRSSSSSSLVAALSPRHRMIPSSVCRLVVQKFRQSVEGKKKASDRSIDTASCSSSSSCASNGSDCRQRCQCLLESPCRQRKTLALEGLVHMANQEISHGQQHSAAYLILTDAAIQQQLVQILVDPGGDSTALDLRTLVLQLLVASLRMLRPRYTEFETTMVDAAPEFWQTVLHGCQSCVANAQECPRDAELAVDILMHVLQIVPQPAMVPRVVRADELLPALMGAHALGQTHLMALEQKSQDLMDQIQAMYQ